MHISEHVRKIEQLKAALYNDEYDFSTEKKSIRMLQFITGMLITLCFGVAFCAGYISVQEQTKNIAIIKLKGN